MYKIIFLVLSKHILGLFETRLNHLMLTGNYFNSAYSIITHYDKNISHFSQNVLIVGQIKSY